MNRKNIFILTMFVFVISSCSIRKIVFNKVADSLAPSYKQREKEALRVKRMKEQGIEVPNMMLAFLGEDDVELVGATFPVIIKT